MLIIFSDPEEIKKCLNCRHPKCINCLSSHSEARGGVSRQPDAVEGRIRDYLKLRAGGFSDQSIADKMGIKLQTVKTYRERSAAYA